LREPESSLVTGFAQIGGLSAVLSLSILLNMWHESLFEKEMNPEVKKKKVDPSLNVSVNLDEELADDGEKEETKKDYREVFSFENIQKALNKIEKVNEENQILKDEVQALR
jgi:hypothetical protein